MNESKRLESEIMRRAVVREGVDNVTKLMRLNSEIKGRAIIPEGVEKVSEGK